jgi:TetR/AcrR family fatty acid metabolism transcriptional regulator
LSRARAQTKPEAGEGDRRKEILRAAVAVFATKGYHGCRIADVAKQAGVAYGLVYHYFKNKEELLESVFAESFGRWSAAADMVIEAEGASVAQKLEQIVTFAMEAYRRDPQAVRVLILEIVRSPAFRAPEKVSAMQHLLEATARLIQRGQRAGEFRDDVQAFVAASTLFGALETTLTTFVLGGQAAQSAEGIERAKRDLLSIFLTGMAPKKAGRSAHVV